MTAWPVPRRHGAGRPPAPITSGMSAFRPHHQSQMGSDPHVSRLPIGRQVIFMTRTEAPMPVSPSRSEVPLPRKGSCVSQETGVGWRYTTWWQGSACRYGDDDWRARFVIRVAEKAASTLFMRDDLLVLKLIWQFWKFFFKCLFEHFCIFWITFYEPENDFFDIFGELVFGSSPDCNYGGAPFPFRVDPRSGKPVQVNRLF